MAERGLRVLGVARGRWRGPALAPDQSPPWPQSQHDFDFDFLGLVALAAVGGIIISSKLALDSGEQLGLALGIGLVVVRAQRRLEVDHRRPVHGDRVVDVRERNRVGRIHLILPVEVRVERVHDDHHLARWVKNAKAMKPGALMNVIGVEMSRFYGLRNRDYGTQVVGGVNPRKAGTSVDFGGTWTECGPAANWVSVSCSHYDLMVAAAENGQLFTTANQGLDWTARESAGTTHSPSARECAARAPGCRGSACETRW